MPKWKITLSRKDSCRTRSYIMEAPTSNKARAFVLARNAEELGIKQRSNGDWDLNGWSITRALVKDETQ
jgi:hypothetical protein